MAAPIILNGLAVLCGIDAGFVLALAWERRRSRDPGAERGALCIAATMLSAGIFCAIAGGAA